MIGSSRPRVAFRPGDPAWRVGALFIVGSALFAVGSFPLYAQNVDARVVATTFFVGSIFFTTAAASQLLLAVGPARGWWADRRSIEGWGAGVVQLAGTILFNISTFVALSDRLTTTQENRLVWAPDVFGSAAFLVASALAWRDVAGWRWTVDTGDDDWRVAALNALGSVFFAFSAVGAFTVPDTGELVSLTLVNTGTFLGAVCFLVGAYLVLPAEDG